MSLKAVHSNENKDPNDINKLTVSQLKDELRSRGLRVDGNKSDLKARVVMYLENQEELDDEEVVIGNTIGTSELLISAATDTTVVNGDFQSFLYHRYHRCQW